MYQIDNPTASSTQPASTPAGTPGFFTDGSVGGDIPPTIVPAEWLNAVQQELINVLVLAEITPQKNVFNQLATAIASLIRNKLTSNIILYVSPTGTDAIGQGLSAAAPFKTITYAYSFLRNNYDLNGYTATIQLANGTYAPAIISGRVVGDSGSAVSINGSATAGAVTVATTANGQACFTISGNSAITVSGLTMTAASFTQCNGIFISIGSTFLGGANLTFGSFPSGQHILSAGQCQIGNYTITGGASSHLIATGPGYIQIAGTNTITGTPAFSGQFAVAQNLGQIFAATATSYSGSATGARYLSNTNSVINTQGGGANFFPGNAAGSTNAGGQYV